MEGLVAKSIQHFLRMTHGEECWNKVLSEVGLPLTGLSSVGHYNTSLAVQILETAAVQLNRQSREMWEDLGTHLVTHPDLETVRRLLRFGGADFEAFLWSLDDLQDRAQLAVLGMDMPELRLQPAGVGQYALAVRWPGVGETARDVAGPLVVGALRAMADDYGALVFLDFRSSDGDPDTSIIEISLLEAGFAPARDFQLGMDRVS